MVAASGRAAASRPATDPVPGYHTIHDLVLQQWMSSSPTATKARELVIGAGPAAADPVPGYPAPWGAAWLWDLSDSQERKGKAQQPPAVAAIDKLLEMY